MYRRLTVNLDATQRRYETLEGRAHVVVPAAILAEGVWEGSGGPVLYRNEELRRWANGWNHRPMVAYHPTDNGKPISACEPTVLNTRKVGVTLNAKHDDKTRTECWFDVERTRTVDNRILEAIEAGKPIEVSTGLELDLKAGEGDWNGTKYVGEAMNHRPDHLAILPDQKGAYSVQSGGGIYANSAIKDADRLPEGTQTVLFRSLRYGANVLTNELSFSDISSQLSDLLSAKYGQPGKYWEGYLCDVYETYVVFRTDGKAYMIGYTVENDSVSLDGEAQEVERVTEYKVVNGGPTYVGAGGQLTLKEREADMAGNFDRKAHLNGLIGNGYDESDRAKLDKLDDATLACIKPVKAVVANAVTETPPKKFFVQNSDGTYTEAALQPAQQPKQQTLAELVANSNDPAVKAEFGRIRQRFEADKAALVTNILANPNNRFTKEWLDKQDDLDLLSGIAAAGVTSQTQNGTPHQPPMLQPTFFGNAGGPGGQSFNVPGEGLIPVDCQFDSVIK